MTEKGLKKGISFFSEKKALVLGLGKTGLSSAIFLDRCGAVVTATDSKRESEIEAVDLLKQRGIKLELGGHRRDSFLSSEIIVVSPGVDSRMPFLKEAALRGVRVISDVELFFSLTDAPVFAITGTNGKSTTSELLFEVFRHAGKKVFLGGNIGIPVMDAFNQNLEFELSVVEVSSFQLETIKTFRPRVAALLNITEDHLYRYENFSDYADTKFRIFSNQTEDDYAVLNIADPVIKKMFEEGRFKSRAILFSAKTALREGLCLKGASIVWARNGREDDYPMEGIKLSGIHNMENIMAVIASATIGGVKKETILSAVRDFKGLPHRMEFVRERNGVNYINDSKSTNVGSLYRALEGIAVNGRAKVVLIAGGKDKGGDYGVLKEVTSGRVKLLVLIGEAKKRIKDSLRGFLEIVEAESLEDAVLIASKRATSGDTVLLSPACSSFDMFENFEERGKLFRRCVEAL